MEDRLDRIESKLDQIDGKLDDYQLAVEHRVTVLETKSGIFGSIGGFIAGLIASIFVKH